VRPRRPLSSQAGTGGSRGATGVLATSSASIALRELSKMAGGSPVMRRQRSTKTAVGRSATARALDVEQSCGVCAGIPMRSERTLAPFGPFHPAEMVKRTFPRSSRERFAPGRGGPPCACAFDEIRRKTTSRFLHATRSLRDKHPTGGGRRTPQRRRRSPCRPWTLTRVIRGRQRLPPRSGHGAGRDGYRPRRDGRHLGGANGHRDS
jgi:hypothetical protein